MTSHTFLPAGAPLVVPSPSTEGDWQLADDCSTRRTYTVAARVCEWLTGLCVPACLKILGAVAEEPENIITSRRFHQTRGGHFNTSIHIYRWFDWQQGRRLLAVCWNCVGSSSHCRKLRQLQIIAVLAAQDFAPRRARNLELSSISEEKKKHFREYIRIRCENIVKLQSLWYAKYVRAVCGDVMQVIHIFIASR